ncbi:hypothetical protein ABIE41_002081 [Bosea sp. OAE506]|uniref:hypothetical protein n=1 Tax=Bosea sp. OAE506 TaxID=2663870 RepID=UPI0033993C9A
MVTRRHLLAGGIAAPALLPRLVRAQSDTRPILRVAVQALPPTLEPLESISNVGLRVTYNVFDTLWRRDFLAEAAEGAAAARAASRHLAAPARPADLGGQAPTGRADA